MVAPRFSLAVSIVLDLFVANAREIVLRREDVSSTNTAPRFASFILVNPFPARHNHLSAVNAADKKHPIAPHSTDAAMRKSKVRAKLKRNEPVLLTTLHF